MATPFDIGTITDTRPRAAPRYMGRRRSIPGDPPRIRLLRESFTLNGLLTRRDELRVELREIEQRISELRHDMTNNDRSPQELPNGHRHRAAAEP